MLKITIPGRILPKNRQYRQRKGGGFYLDPKFKEYQDFVVGTKKRCGWLAQWGNYNFKGKTYVRPTFYFPDRRYGDTDNYLKTLGDMLQKSGIIENDKDIVWVGLGDEPRKVDKAQPRVEAEIWQT